uniref:HDC19023 n=1 Tax=Drosophila melanogaster TaxID=7227 RepID=Q6IIC3_DROME|nr:TPA_inf: HDC19023 [Drosophila melanogaster]
MSVGGFKIFAQQFYLAGEKCSILLWGAKCPQAVINLSPSGISGNGKGCCFEKERCRGGREGGELENVGQMTRRNFSILISSAMCAQSVKWRTERNGLAFQAVTACGLMATKTDNREQGSGKRETRTEN